IHIPVRHEQRPGLGVKEGARQPGEGLGITLIAGNVAGRKHDPVGIKFQLRHLAGCEQAVVFLELAGRRAVLWRREDQRRFGLGFRRAGVSGSGVLSSPWSLLIRGPESCPPSCRNSTERPVQKSGTTSQFVALPLVFARPNNSATSAVYKHQPPVLQRHATTLSLPAPSRRLPIVPQYQSMNWIT